VENGVPLGEAILLASRTSGHGGMRRAAEGLAAALARGQTLESIDRQLPFPPLLRWIMAAGQRQGALVPALKHAAETYHRRAQHQAELAQRLLPVVITVLVGGGFTLLYAAAVFLPYFRMLEALSGV